MVLLDHLLADRYGRRRVVLSFLRIDLDVAPVDIPASCSEPAEEEVLAFVDRVGRAPARPR